MNTEVEQTQNTSWDEVIQDRDSNDPLAQCLSWLSRYYHRQQSVQVLSAGLPLVDNRMTPELFGRAAARIGLGAVTKKQSLSGFDTTTIPAVLLLQDLKACVVTGKTENGEFRIFDPDMSDTERVISVTELESIYAGYVILVHQVSQAGSDINRKSWRDDEHWFLGTLTRTWRIYSEVIVASLLINMFALASPLFVMNVYDRVVPNNALETLWVLAIGVGIVYLFDFIMKTLRTYFVDAAGKHSDIVMSSRIFEHVMDLEMKERPTSVGSFANNLQEFETFREFFTSSTLVTLIDLPFVIIFLAVIMAIGGPIVLVPLAAIPLVVMIGLVIQLPLRKLIEATFKAAAHKHGVLIETLSGFEVVKTLRAQGILQKRWETQVTELARMGQKSRMYSTTAINSAMLVHQLAYVGVVIYGVYVINSGNLTLGGLIACTILTGRALTPMAQITQLLVRYHQSTAAFKSINRIMHLPVERPVDKSFISRPEVKGDIEFKGVTFSYPDQPVPAVNELSFSITAGERVAIIGRIGSGKSTIQKLMLGLYKPDSGTILIDGTDIRQIDPIELRNNIGYVPQEIILFGGTIRDNITMGAPPVDDDTVMNAAEIAGIAEHIQQHPNGLDIQVGERGANLSGGQRQAIAIARSVLLRPSLLLLDEPTNSLDNSTEEKFKNNVVATLTNTTLVLVTHKATPLSLVDRLIVVDHGKLVADGPRDQVISALSSNQVKAAEQGS